MISNKIFLLLFIFPFNKLFAQADSLSKVPNDIDNTSLYARYTTEVKRNQLYTRLIQNSINKNLSLPLNENTEENWEDGFGASELLLLKLPWITAKAHYAFDSINQRSTTFQRSLLELVYTNYPVEFDKQVIKLLQQTTDPKIFAMSAEYLMQIQNDDKAKKYLSEWIESKFDTAENHPLLVMLKSRLKQPVKWQPAKILTGLLSNNFLKGKIILYSVQRKNRNYPGLIVIRKKDGSFVKDESGNIFSVPQLARSITNLPGYLTNGNTPQGIFRMYGFDVSMSQFIGPTPNIQLTMPVEASLQRFFNDSTITDSMWTEDWYKKLLPESIRNYFPLFESYYAGKAGRTEIIAHGTAINPDYYKGTSYYPLTPSQGCLSTKEIWNGKRLESDQQKLINALLKAGGADGYCVVVEINDKNEPVTSNEILPYLPPVSGN